MFSRVFQSVSSLYFLALSSIIVHSNVSDSSSKDKSSSKDVRGQEDPCQNGNGDNDRDNGPPKVTSSSSWSSGLWLPREVQRRLDDVAASL